MPNYAHYQSASASREYAAGRMTTAQVSTFSAIELLEPTTKLLIVTAADVLAPVPEGTYALHSDHFDHDLFLHPDGVVRFYYLPTNGRA